MIYKNFLALKGKDFKGRTLEDIGSFQNKDIEENLDFIQKVFSFTCPVLWFKKFLVRLWIKIKLLMKIKIS